MHVLNKIFSKTTDAVFASDASGQIIYANKSFLYLCNRSLSDILGHPCYEMVQAQTLNGENFCRPDCPIVQATKRNDSIEHFDLMIPQLNSADVWVNIGVLFAPAEWQPAKVIFTVRPFSVHRILDRFSSSQKLTTQSKTNDHKLTRRQQQIIRLLAQSSDARTIADTLHISYATVRNHINNIYHKLGIHSRAEVISYAYDNGFI